MDVGPRGYSGHAHCTDDSSFFNKVPVFDIPLIHVGEHQNVIFVLDGYNIPSATGYHGSDPTLGRGDDVSAKTACNRDILVSIRSCYWTLDMCVSTLHFALEQKTTYFSHFCSSFQFD